MNVTQTGKNVLTVLFDDVKSGWEQWFLLSSDRHFDSMHCDRKLMFADLNKARERNALIIDTGDFFSMMQGKYDPRKNYDDMRPEYLFQDYLGAIVEDAVAKFTDYADMFLVMGKGNHDLAIKKHNNFDVMSALVSRLNDKAKTHIQLGGYGGWVRFQFVEGNHRVRKQLHYFHGSGGGAEVTRGVIRTNRMAVYIEGADIVMTGHTHDSWHVPIEKLYLNNKGVITKSVCHFINCGTYEDSYGEGDEGWWVESGKSPRPRGAVWLRFYLESHEIKTDITLAVV